MGPDIEILPDEGLPGNPGWMQRFASRGQCFMLIVLSKGSFLK